MSHDIKDIEGIGPGYAEKLAAAKIRTTDDLLSQCADPQGRKKVAKVTGLGESHILKWANMADIMRISGVGSQFSELLEASGVDTVKELATRNVENLAARMKEVNEAKKLAKSTPSVAQVEKWVAEAKTIGHRITY